MDIYRCEDCGEEHNGRELWVCEDDKLRCGKCLDRRMERAEVVSAVHDHVEGRLGTGR